VNRLARAVLVAAIALLVPLVLTVNGVRLIANDWYVRFEYGRLPPDASGLTRAQRTELGLTGLHSILPRNEEGIGLLRRAKLPDGGPAFRDKELGHMSDVRRLVGILYPAHLAALAGIAALALGLALARRGPTLVPQGLAYGAGLTLALAALVALAVAVSADGFLTGFHRLFFEGESWRFRETDTLRRLYPDRFWSETAIWLGVGAAAQALLLLTGSLVWLRKRQAIGVPSRRVLRAPAEPRS
jgi:integral membrane protein (TIGR01906 family)